MKGSRSPGGVVLCRRSSAGCPRALHPSGSPSLWPWRNHTHTFHPTTPLGFKTCSFDFLAPGSQCPPPTPSPIPYIWDPGAKGSRSSLEAAPGPPFRTSAPILRTVYSSDSRPSAFWVLSADQSPITFPQPAVSLGRISVQASGARSFEDRSWTSTAPALGGSMLPPRSAPAQAPGAAVGARRNLSLPGAG